MKIIQQKERKVGSEAPAIRLTMENGETKVIGMMADKVQVLITLSQPKNFTEPMIEIIEKHQKKSLVYIICSEKISLPLPIDTSRDFENFALKMGVYLNEEYCANSIFIINKDGEIVYKEVIEDFEATFDTQSFDTALEGAIRFKKKGHTHENWMGV